MHAAVPVGERGWHRTGDLLDDPGLLRAVVEQGARALARAQPGGPAAVRSTVAAALLLSDWCWALAALGAGPLALDGRIPVLSPSAVWLHVADARVTGVATTSAQFSCVAADPEAQHPDALVVGDLDTALRGALTAHLERLHLALRHGPVPLLRRGPRAMYGSAGDGLATALRLQAEQAEDGEDLLKTAERLLAQAPASWGRHGFDRSATGVSRVRTSCCLWYRLPDTSACASCPRTLLRKGLPPGAVG